MTAFTKNQPVTYVGPWSDTTGAAFIYEATVYSCGAKQMVLVDDAGAKFQGHFFKPQSVQGGHRHVVARLDRAAAEALALEVSAAHIASRIAHYEDRIQRWGKDPETDAYTRAMVEGLAHAKTLKPSFIHR